MEGRARVKWELKRVTAGGTSTTGLGLPNFDHVLAFDILRLIQPSYHHHCHALLSNAMMCPFTAASVHQRPQLYHILSSLTQRLSQSRLLEMIVDVGLICVTHVLNIDSRNQNC